MQMTVTQFKAKCLGVIEKVATEKAHVTITRHGKPAVAVVPVSSSFPGALFGRASKTTQIQGNLISTDENWDAET